MVYDIDSVLNVLRSHFSRLSMPKEAAEYDQDHYVYVTNKVREWSNEAGTYEFLENPFTSHEIYQAINKLHPRKAPGHDCISAEHLKHGGRPLCDILCIFFNICLRAEYIPSIAGTVRTMYVHCTYSWYNVRTMYVHCTYSARWVISDMGYRSPYTRVKIPAPSTLIITGALLCSPVLINFSKWYFGAGLNPGGRKTV